MIFATAGHVDHGKTELIKAITGIDTDQLPEEKRRGLSIDLGFAYYRLADGTRLGFVDVPGHEKFIRNMLAGVAGIDMGLLVVAADDGVMPQTSEHLSILNLLGIKKCVIVLTKIDRASGERRLEAEKEINKLLKKFEFTDCELYSVCAPQNIGIEALRNGLIQRAHQRFSKDPDHYFRMSIDRAFSLNGIGLVVTGMIFSGSVCISDKLMLSSNGMPVRIREIRSNNQVTSKAKVGERCALNISGRGISERSIKRGTWLTHPNLNVLTRRIDVDLKVLETEPNSLKHWTSAHLHIGSDHLNARVAVLSGGNIPIGKSSLAQLVLPRDIHAVYGDRFVLRDQSAQRTIGGGRVIDPFAPKRGRSRPTRIATLMSIRKGSTKEVLTSLAERSNTGVPLKQFTVSHNVQPSEIDNLISLLSLRRVGKSTGQRLFSEKKWQDLLYKVIKSISDFHKLKPSSDGASVKEVQTLLNDHIDTLILADVLTELLFKKRLVEKGSRFRLPQHEAVISDKNLDHINQVLMALSPKFGTPPSFDQLAQKTAIKSEELERILRLCLKRREIVMIGKNRYITDTQINKLKAIAKNLSLKSTNGLFTIVDYRDASGLSRNFAVALLEYFDQVGFTTRTGDYREIRRYAKPNQKVESNN